jgi:hypothetical protein
MPPGETPIAVYNNNNNNNNKIISLFLERDESFGAAAANCPLVPSPERLGMGALIDDNRQSRNRSIRGKPFPIATLSTTNPRCTTAY